VAAISLASVDSAPPISSPVMMCRILIRLFIVGLASIHIGWRHISRRSVMTPLIAKIHKTSNRTLSDVECVPQISPQSGPIDSDGSQSANLEIAAAGCYEPLASPFFRSIEI
jgi:hypothetical protein